MRTSKVYSISDDEFINLIQNSDSYSNCLRALGLGTRGGSSLDILKRRISELKCSTEHFNGGKTSGAHQRYLLSDILVENSSYANIQRLKIRLLNENLLTYKCAICNLTNWQGQPISLHLDHINGQNNDHRIENLRLLCPNCHSQTDTYAGKNKYNTGSSLTEK